MANTVRLIGIITAIPGSAAAAGSLLYRAVVTRNDTEDFEEFCSEDFPDAASASQYCDQIAQNTSKNGSLVELKSVDTTGGEGGLNFIASDWFIGTSLTLTAIGLVALALSDIKLPSSMRQRQLVMAA